MTRPTHSSTHISLSLSLSLSGTGDLVAGVFALSRPSGRPERPQ